MWEWDKNIAVLSQSFAFGGFLRQILVNLLKLARRLILQDIGC